jgi:hypothetical protein
MSYCEGYAKSSSVLCEEYQAALTLSNEMTSELCRVMDWTEEQAHVLFLALAARKDMHEASNLWNQQVEAEMMFHG